MSASKSTDLILDQALKTLNSYDCVQPTVSESSVELEQLRSSLLLVKDLSSALNIGICADNFQQGYLTLVSYLQGFSYQSDLEKNQVTEDSEPVYLKFSTQKMSYYSDIYTGKYRGVLISCQSENDQVVGTYGHFPLDLFMNN